MWFQCALTRSLKQVMSSIFYFVMGLGTKFDTCLCENPSNVFLVNAAFTNSSYLYSTSLNLIFYYISSDALHPDAK